MKMTLRYYGRLTELTGKTSEEISLKDYTAQNISIYLKQNYPQLQDMTFQLAENNNILNYEDTIKTQVVDVFPPFSGG